MSQLRIHITISNYNTSARLAETLESIARQTYKNYTLVVVDACSTDSFEHYVEPYRVLIDKIIVDKDNGLYDGLSKAFSFERGQGIYAYINAGDVYMPYAFEVIVEAFEKSGCQWLTGLPAFRDSKQRLVGISRPWPYMRCLLRQGFYDGKILPFIQQESVFWSYRLHKLIDVDTLSRFRLAGDFYLWTLFANYSDLHILGICVSSFTVHGGHLSESIGEYRKEARSVAPFTSRVAFLLPLAIFYSFFVRFCKFPSAAYGYLPCVINL